MYVLSAINMVVTLKKRLYLILASITVMIGSGYYLSGKIIQADYYKIVARYNQNKNTKVSLLSYKRGIFHSQAKLELQIPSINSNKPQILPLQQTISHGPLVAVNTPNGFSLKFIASQIETCLDGEWQAQLVKYTGNSKPLTMNTIVDFSDQATTWITGAAINKTTTDNMHITWSALQGEISHDVNFANYTGNISLPKISIKTDNWDLSIDELLLKLEKSTQTANYLNNKTLRSKSISFNRLQNPIIQIDDIAARLEFIKNPAQNIDIGLNINVVDSKILQQKFAQDNIKLQINNLDTNNFPGLPAINALNIRTSLEFMQQLTNAKDTRLTIELTKHFTEALISYLSYEIYKSSMLGKLDKRSDEVIMRDIASSINKLIVSSLNSKLFIDQGMYYALNFDRKSS